VHFRSARGRSWPGCARDATQAAMASCFFDDGRRELLAQRANLPSAGFHTGSRALHLPVGSVSVRRCHRRALDLFRMRPRWTVRFLSVPHASESSSRIPPAPARWSVRSLNERDRQDRPNKNGAPTGPWERGRYTAGSPHARIGPIAHA
jgi:hypothetical protein